MKASRSMINALCYAAEGLSGTAAATSLRKMGSIMEQAPQGRLFGAIATLSDMSAKAAQALEDGSAALDRADEDTAAERIGLALIHMDGVATLSAEVPAARARRRSAR